MDSRLSDYGIVVPGIYPEHGEFIGVPSKEAVVSAGDTVMVHGSEDAVNRLVRGGMRKVNR